MKIKSLLLTTLLAATAFTFTRCGGNKTEASHDHAATAEHASGSTAPAEASAPQFTVNAAFQQQLAGVFTAYVALKEAFVSSDAAKISTQAGVATKALTAADMKLLSGAAHNDWMTYLEAMQTSLKEIESSTDVDIQREAFSTLSENLYKSIKAYGLGGATAFYEYCPMAFDNRGAFWLSDAEAIRNPYFGNDMLTCGSVKEKLQ